MNRVQRIVYPREQHQLSMYQTKAVVETAILRWASSKGSPIRGLDNRFVQYPSVTFLEYQWLPIVNPMLEEIILARVQLKRHLGKTVAMSSTRWKPPWPSKHSNQRSLKSLVLLLDDTKGSESSLMHAEYKVSRDDRGRTSFCKGSYKQSVDRYSRSVDRIDQGHDRSYINQMQQIKLFSWSASLQKENRIGFGPFYCEKNNSITMNSNENQINCSNTSLIFNTFEQWS